MSVDLKIRNRPDADIIHMGISDSAKPIVPIQQTEDGYFAYLSKYAKDTQHTIMAVKGDPEGVLRSRVNGTLRFWNRRDAPNRDGYQWFTVPSPAGDTHGFLTADRGTIEYVIMNELLELSQVPTE